MLVGRNIVYGKGTAEIVNISLGGSAICLRMSWKDVDEPKHFHESEEWIPMTEICDRLGDTVTIDSDHILTDSTKILPLTVKSLIDVLSNVDKRFSYKK